LDAVNGAYLNSLHPKWIDRFAERALARRRGARKGVRPSVRPRRGAVRAGRPVARPRQVGPAVPSDAAPIVAAHRGARTAGEEREV